MIAKKSKACQVDVLERRGAEPFLIILLIFELVRHMLGVSASRACAASFRDLGSIQRHKDGVSGSIHGLR